MRKIFMQFASLLTSGSRGRHITMKRVSLGILLAGVLSATAGVAQAAGPPTGVTCGSVITAPGQYFLTGDCSGAGITITASNVHLKLMGHTMTGIPFADGLSAINVSHLHIQGPGIITGYHAGISFLEVSDSHVEQVSATANGIGLFLQASTDIHVNNNAFSANSSGGMNVVDQSSHNHLNNNQTISNGFNGIFVGVGSTGNHINANTALLNAFDLFDANANCDNNKWNGNTFNTSNQPTCIR
jgi:hypothetical protein